MKMFLGKGGARGNISVFLTADCLEIEEQFAVDIARRRIYLDDIVMVTRSRRFGWFRLLTAGLRASFFGFAALVTLISTREFAVAAVLGVIAAIFAGRGVLRLIARMDVITVFGRRKKVEINFGLDKKQLQPRFDLLVNAIREKIAATNARIEREKPAQLIPDAGPMPIATPVTDSIEPSLAQPGEVPQIPAEPADPWTPPKLRDEPQTDAGSWVRPDEPPQG